MNIRFLSCDEDLAKYWGDVSRLLRPVVERAARGEFTLADIRSGVDRGSVVVAVCSIGDKPEFAGAFHFKHYPQYMTVNIMAVGGRMMNDFAEVFWDTFKSWAKGAGAAHIEASCNAAMSRVLKRYGFEHAYNEMRIAL